MQKKILLLLSVILVFVTSVVYSALSTSLSITSEVRFRVLADIRVNGVTMSSANGGILAYDSEYSKNTVSNGFTLPTQGSSISYTVHVDNTGDVDYAIYDILQTTVASGLDVTVSGYNLQDVIPARTSVNLVLTYTTSNPSNSVINVVNTFDFKKVHYIDYVTGTSQTIPQQIKYEGVPLTLTSTQPTKNGYAFSKWNTKSDGTGTNYDSGATYTVDEDPYVRNVTLYAKYTLATYNITYVLNGGTNDANNPSTYTIESNDITLGDASKTGYTFKGWTGNGTTNPTKNLVLAHGSYGDKTFTAVFEDETDPEITVTSQDETINYLTQTSVFNAAWDTANGALAYKINATDNGSGISTIEYAITNSSIAPTTGWTTTTNGDHSDTKVRGTYYLHVRATDAAGNTTTVTTQTMTVRFRVAYHDDYATDTSITDNQYYTGTALTSRTPNAKTGYTFDGWYNSTALTTKVVNANTSYTPTTSIKLYGKWTPTNYSITYAMNNGTNNGNNPDNYTIESDPITLQAPTKTLTFTGHYNETAGANASSTSGVSITENNQTAVQIFAGWSGTGLTGNNNTTVTIPTGSTGDRSYTAHWTSVSPAKLPKVTRTGYTCGWSTSNTGTTIKYASEATNYPQSPDTITEGQVATVDLYAVCNPNTYQLTINPNGGTYNSTTSTSTKTMTYDSTNNNDIGTPTRSGYTFAGWYTQENGGVQLFGTDGHNTNAEGYWSAAYSTGVWKKTSAVTVYAKWTKSVADLTKSVSPTSYIYDGNAKTPTPSVSDGGTTLTNGTHYTATYSNNTNVGTATATITGAGVYNSTTKAYYTGTTTVTYAINNAQLTFDVGSCGSISGTTQLYTKKGATGVYTELRGTTAGTVPTASKTGYTFQGWYTATSNGTKVLNSDKSFTGSAVTGYTMASAWDVVENKTLYAVCTPNTYTVVYNNSCDLTSSGSMSNSSHTYDTAKDLNSNAYGCSAAVTYNYNGATGGNSTTSDTATATFLGWTVGGPNLLRYRDLNNSNLMTINDDGTLSYNYTNSSSSSAYANFFYKPNSNLKVSTNYVFVTDIKTLSSISAYNSMNIAQTNTGTQLSPDYQVVYYTGAGLNYHNTQTISDFSSANNYALRGFMGITAGTSRSMKFRPILFEGTYNGKDLYYYDEGSVLNLATSGTVNVYTDWTEPSVTLPTPTKTGYTFQGWYSNSTLTTKVGNGGDKYTPTGATNLYAKWTINNPGTPTISGGATKIYGASATTLTCTENTSYASGTSKYYSFGYASSDGGTPGNWTTASTSNQLNISATEYVGQRWYSCRVYASDGTLTSSTITSAAASDTEMTINNAKLTFDVGSCGSTSGDTILYTKKDATKVYTGIRNTTDGTIPTASKKGHTFNGWYTASSGGSKVLNANGGFTGTAVTNYTDASSWQTVADQTLYAQCTPNKIHLTLDPSPGSGGTTDIWYYYGTSVFYSNAACTTQITAITRPTRTGYTFVNYHGDGTSGGANGERYIAYDNVEFADDLATDIYQDATMYAQWSAKTYTLTIDPQGGTYNSSTSNATKTMTYDSTNNNDIGIPTRSGYTFNGWYTATSGGTQIYGTDGHNTNASSYWTAAYSTGKWKYDGNVTVYARWSKAVSTLTNSLSQTTYIYNGSAQGPTATVKDDSTTLTLNTDYTVSGNSNINVGQYSVTITGANAYNSTTKAYYSGTTTLTYYINNATLTFNAGNCSSVSASTLYTKKGATKVYTGIRNTTEGSLPTVTVPTGYTFQGWYNANSGGSKVLNANGGFTGTAVTNYTDASSWQTVADQNLYARCTANTYTIGYTMNGGPDPSSKPTSGTYNSDVQISNPSSKVITISGDANGTGATVGSATTVTQTFAGWTSSSGAGLGGNAKSGTSASPSTAWDGTSTKNTYFRNLRDSSGTVTMTANWNTAAGTLPTLTNPTGYTCRYYSAPTGGNDLGVGGASYTPGATSGTSITVYVRCTANSYSIAYTMNGGPDPSTKPNGGTFNSDVQISNPSSKVITITASANGTSATVGSATTVTQTFAGWTSSSGAGLGGNAKSGTSASPTTAWTGSSTTNTYFRNLRDSSGTVTMTANWNTAAGTLPTLTNPTGYTCKYYSASTGGNELGVGGASYTPGATSGTSITVYARCTANTYTIAYSMNNGPNPSTKPTSGTYNSDVQISNPGSKSITVTGNVNGTGASIGSATTGTQTFAGWTSSSGAGLGSGAKTGTSANPSTAWTGSSTTNTYFKNLRDSSGTVTMTANWSGSMTLPTLSKAGHTCRWYTDPTSGSEMGAGGATWTIPNGSSTSVTAYARCTVNNYNVTFDNNYLASNIWANTSRTSSYGSSGVDPTAKIEVEDSSVANGYYIEFTMPTGSGGGPYYPAAKLTNGQTYTWSVEVKASKSTSLTIGHEQGGTKSVDITTSWQRFTHTFTANNGNYTAFVFYYGSWTAGDKLYVKNLYIEAGNGSQNKSTSSKQYASQLGTLSSPTRSGYTFAGWFTAPTGGTQISATTTVPANDVTYYAHWTANKYYLDLNGWLDGASSGGISPYGTADVYVNGSQQANDVSDYYTQWYTGSTYQISDIKATTGHTYVGVHSGSLTGTIAGSNVGTVLEFTTDSHTVSYSCTENEGTGTVSSASVAYNTAVNLPSTGCTKSGWTFLGWNTNKDATSALSAGDVVMGTSNITLYAIYRKELTATLSANNGATISPTSNSCYIYNKQQTCGVSITSITPQSGFSVIGINNNSSATTNSGSYNTSSKILTISSSGTWYPITSKTNTATFTITDTNAATGGGQVSCTRYNGAASCTITASTITAKSGYVALGWNATQNATSATVNSGQTNVSINSDITYYSVTYLSATVTVTFNKTAHVTSQTPYGGSASTASSVTVSCTKYNGASSCTIKSPTFAVDTGYHVGGYIIDGGSTTWDVNTDKSVSSNATYNSVAAGNVYSIHFNANCPSGTTASGSMANQSKTYGTPVTLNANAFSCTNRVFAGWATSASGEVVYSDGGTFPSSTDPISTAGGTTELYAKWRITPPGTPTISSSASTKVYGAAATLTCTENTTYPSGITKYYQFAYTTTNGATPADNAWSTKSTSNTFDITNADLGVKYYSCRVWAEKDAESSITKVSASNAQAQVTINNATLTFDAGSCGTVSSSTAYVRKGTEGAFNGIRGTTSSSLPTFTAASGKSFNGWYNGNTLVIDSGGLVVAGVSNWTDSNKKWLITENKTLTASCSNVGYNIAYAMQNGTNNGSNPSTYNVTTSDITLQAPTKTLTFTGHYNETSGANASSLSGVVIDSPNPTSQAQTFLGWSIGIGANMGTTIYSSITIPQGSTGDKSYTARWSAVAGTVPTVHKTGYTCGWSLSSSGTSIDIGSGGTFGTNRITEGMATTVDLYAVCIPNTYQVAYNGNGSTGGSMSNSTHTYDVAKNLTSNAYTRTGYVFTGWNTAADGSGTSYSNGQSVTNLSTGTTVTLYAQWVELWAENISYSYSSDCTDVQCTIDYLWSRMSSY